MKKINKYLICSFVAFLFFFMFTFKANAVSITNDNITQIVDIKENNKVTSIVTPAVDDEKCEAIFGDKIDPQYPAYWIQWILNVMKYIAIIALLVLVTMDFFKALVANDKDALKKAGSTAVKRFIYCVMIFFLPIIVDLIMSLFGAYGTCGIG